MPRVSGVSASSTVYPSRRRPRPVTTLSCFRSNPIVLFTSVIRSFFADDVFAFALFAMPLRSLRRRRLFFLFLAAETPHELRILQPGQSGEGGAHDVVRVRGTNRLRQDVLDAGRLHDRAYCAARDDPGAV